MPRKKAVPVQPEVKGKPKANVQKPTALPLGEIGNLRFTEGGRFYKLTPGVMFNAYDLIEIGKGEV